MAEIPAGSMLMKAKESVCVEGLFRKTFPEWLQASKEAIQRQFYNRRKSEEEFDEVKKSSVSLWNGQQQSESDARAI